MTPQCLPASPPPRPTSHMSWSFKMEGKSLPYQKQMGCQCLMEVNAAGLEIIVRTPEILVRISQPHLWEEHVLLRCSTFLCLSLSTTQLGTSYPAVTMTFFLFNLLLKSKMLSLGKNFPLSQSSWKECLLFHLFLSHLTLKIPPKLIPHLNMGRK